MARRQRGRRRRQQDAPAPAGDVDQDFLARVAAEEGKDPDEPGRWGAFFQRLRGLLGKAGADAR